MITIRLDIGGWLKFRMVDSSGAAVTGLLDGDFVTRRYSVGSGASWDDLSGTISEGEAGWYRIEMQDFEAESYGQAVAYFSDGTNESHITFMVDDVRDNVTTLSTSVATINSKVTMSLAAIVVGQTTYDIQTGTTEDTLQLISGACATLDQDAIGATVVVFSGGGGFRVSQVVSVDAVLDTVTISPAMPSALPDGEKVLFVRTLPTLLDRPESVDLDGDLYSLATALTQLEVRITSAISAAQGAQIAAGFVGGGLFVSDAANITTSGTPTTTTFEVSDWIGQTTREVELQGCLVMSDSGAFLPRVIQSFDSTTGVAVVAPAWPIAPDPSFSCKIMRPQVSHLDHPDGVDTGFSHARALRKIGSSVVAKSSGADADGGSQVIRNMSDTADEMTVTYDDFGNRTGISHTD